MEYIVPRHHRSLAALASLGILMSGCQSDPNPDKRDKNSQQAPDITCTEAEYKPMRDGTDYLLIKVEDALGNRVKNFDIKALDIDTKQPYIEPMLLPPVGKHQKSNHYAIDLRHETVQLAVTILKNDESVPCPTVTYPGRDFKPPAIDEAPQKNAS